MSLYKRGNVYWTKFGLRGQIFRHSLRTSDPEKAKRKETQFIAQAAQGKLRAWTDPFERLPFHRVDPEPDRLGALERYLREHKPALAASTAQNEPYHAKGLAEFFGATRVSNITESMIREYISKRHGDGRANATINKELRILIAVLRRAKRWHLFSDEVKGLRVRKSKVGRALELDEKLWLLRASQQKKSWWRARLAMVLALNTTMRAGEIRNLQWQDIDWLERTLLVRRGKTDESQRELWLNDEAFSAIGQLREEAKEFFGEDLAPEWHLFFSWPRDGEPDPTRPMASWRTAWRSMVRSIVCSDCGRFQDPGERCANEKCGADIRKVRSPIAGLRFHDLRHQAITELSEGGASDETIMSIAGHIDRRMMSHYSHIRKQARRAALEQLGKTTTNFAEGHNQGTVAPERCNREAMRFSQLVEKIGGDDGTRTRDLCRDRAAF
jgi:integrase